MNQAKFITSEGMDGAGKSTHLAWLADTMDRLCGKSAIHPADSEFEVAYINGGYNIPAVFTSLEPEGGNEEKLKIRQIEPEFLGRMFAVEGG